MRGWWSSLPVAVHVEQPCEDKEEKGSEDSDEDPNRLLGLEVCHNNKTCAFRQSPIPRCGIIWMTDEQWKTLCAVGPEWVLTVGDSDLKRRTPFAPKAMVGLAAHLDDVCASWAQAEDVKHFLLTCKMHLWRRTHSQITHSPFTTLSEGIKNANILTNKSWPTFIQMFCVVTWTMGPNLQCCSVTLTKYFINTGFETLLMQKLKGFVPPTHPLHPAWLWARRWVWSSRSACRPFAAVPMTPAGRASSCRPSPSRLPSPED